MKSMYLLQKLLTEARSLSDQSKPYILKKTISIIMQSAIPAKAVFLKREAMAALLK